MAGVEVDPHPGVSASLPLRHKARVHGLMACQTGLPFGRDFLPLRVVLPLEPVRSVMQARQMSTPGLPLQASILKRCISFLLLLKKLTERTGGAQSIHINTARPGQCL